ncbi:hypothetical protein Tco_0454455 [Tanacetum coccineum]
MLRGWPVISAGFQAKISKFCLSKELRFFCVPFLVNVGLWKTVCSGYFRCGLLYYFFFPIIGLTAERMDAWSEIIEPSIGIDSDCLMGEPDNHEVHPRGGGVCTSSPILTSKAIWPSGQMVSPLNPISAQSSAVHFGFDYIGPSVSVFFPQGGKEIASPEE